MTGIGGGIALVDRASPWRSTRLNTTFRMPRISLDEGEMKYDNILVPHNANTARVFTIHHDMKEAFYSVLLGSVLLRRAYRIEKR